MADNTTGSNRNWQEWLVDQGLQPMDSATPAARQASQAGSEAQGPHAAQIAQFAQASHASPSPQSVHAAPLAQAASGSQPVRPTASAQSAQPASASVPAPYAQVAPGTQPAQASRGNAPSVPASVPTASHAANRADVKAAAKQEKKAGKQGSGFKTFALGFLGAACAFALGTGIVANTGLLSHTEFVEVPAQVEETASGVVLGSDTSTAVLAQDDHSESLAEAVADKVLPSIVGIDVYASYSGGYGTFWGAGSTESEALSGLGSGVIISKDGYILTNYHVVEGASKLMVTANGEEHEAVVVGTDESSDLAVIKVDAEGLTPVEIGTSDGLKAGQWVMTLGSPFGLEQSVATGIISATDRTVVIQNSSSVYSYGQQVAPSIYSNMIQTDAAINPGNSGGALVDSNGRLIGINSVIESYSGSYSGVGFAIPVDYAMNIAGQIIDGKTPTHAQLGVSATTVDRDLATRYNLPVSAGAYINKVYDESGAQAAGLEQGDIITKIAGTSVDSSTDLVARIRVHNPGETVVVTVVRGDETLDIEVTLGSDEDVLGENGSQEQGGGWGSQENSHGGFSYEELEELLDSLR